jgi:hypothetical protein
MAGRSVLIAPVIDIGEAKARGEILRKVQERTFVKSERSLRLRKSQNGVGSGGVVHERAGIG